MGERGDSGCGRRDGERGGEAGEGHWDRAAFRISVEWYWSRPRRGLDRLSGSPPLPMLAASLRAPFEFAMPRLTAAGSFDVSLTPLTLDPPGDDSARGRMRLDKRFHGGLDATGAGEMLTDMGAVSGSAAYVAIERITGTLDGRGGSFLVVHRGVMTRGVQDLVVSIVPDSGTGELTGIEGSMTLIVGGGKHDYRIDAAVPDAA